MWSPGRTLEDVEKEVIFQALSFYHGNRTQTARSLGIALRTLQNKLEIYNNASVQTARGSDMEPVSKVSEECAMPLQERQEVQAVPSSKNAKGAKSPKAK